MAKRHKISHLGKGKTKKAKRVSAKKHTSKHTMVKA
jgi:hypothetical protein